MTRRLLLLLACLLTVTPALAQTLTTAATKVSTSATTAVTLTLIPEPTEYVVLSTVDITNCAGASAVTAAAVTSVTTTNIEGSLAWTIGSGVAAGLCQPVIAVSYPNGLRSQLVGAPVTVVLPAFATNQTIRVTVAWRSGK